MNLLMKPKLLFVIVCFVRGRGVCCYRFAYGVEESRKRRKMEEDDERLRTVVLEEETVRNAKIALYGAEGAECIKSIEENMDKQYDICVDKFKPVYWPVLPLKM